MEILQGTQLYGTPLEFAIRRSNDSSTSARDAANQIIVGMYVCSSVCVASPTANRAAFYNNIKKVPTAANQDQKFLIYVDNLSTNNREELTAFVAMHTQQPNFQIGKIRPSQKTAGSFFTTVNFQSQAVFFAFLLCCAILFRLSSSLCLI